MDSIGFHNFLPDDHVFFLPSQQTNNIVAQLVKHFNQTQTAMETFSANLDTINTDKLKENPYTVMVATQPENLDDEVLDQCKAMSVGILLAIQDYNLVSKDYVQNADYLVVFSDTPTEAKKKVFADFNLGKHWNESVLLTSPETLVINNKKSDDCQILELVL